MAVREIAETQNQCAATGMLSRPYLGIPVNHHLRRSWHYVPYCSPLCGTFSVALGALGLLGTMSTGRQVTENLHLRNLTYELPAGNILTCRQTLPMRHRAQIDWSTNRFRNLTIELSDGNKQSHAGRELPQGGDPKTDQASKGADSELLGWQPEETEALTAKARYDCLNNATVVRRPEAVGWAPQVGQAR